MKEKKISKKEFADLLITFLVGNFVREVVSVEQGDNTVNLDKQLDIIMDWAIELGFPDLLQEFHGSRLPRDYICKKEEEIIGEYNDITFWEDLEVKLGQRDFYSSLTEKEREEVVKEFWLPDIINKFYEKYREEFEEYGIDRLEVVERRK